MSDHSSNWAPGTFFNFHAEGPVESYENFKLGMWMFLATEVLLFGGIFAAYFIFKWRYPDVFIPGAEQLDWVMGATNTAILLASSFTMALAVDAAQRGQQKKLKLTLILTLVGAAGFLVVKYFEYGAKYGHGWFLPVGDSLDGLFSLYFSITGGDLSTVPVEKKVDVFFSVYYMATMLHLLHVLIGASFIILVLFRATKGRYHEENFGGVEVCGLYWHLVDIIWIFLFPLLYLI